MPGSRLRPKSSDSRSKAILIIHLIMISCDDIETNPGPNMENALPDFPCAVCTEDVSWNADALQCDGCDL